MHLGPKPTQAEISKAKHRNYIIRMRAFRFVLEEFARANGGNPENFCIFFDYFEKEEEEGEQTEGVQTEGEQTEEEKKKEIRQFFMGHCENGRIIEDGIPAIPPMGILWDAIAVHCYEKYSNAMGIIRLGSKVKPLVKINGYPQIAEWVPAKKTKKK